jgi:hypothetical protein
MTKAASTPAISTACSTASTPPAAGQTLSAGDMQKVPADIRGVNGMLFRLRRAVCGRERLRKKIPSGVYRITDSNSDDMPDKVEMLREFDAGSDHGVHAVLLTPDGKGLYLISGNNAVLKEGPKPARQTARPCRSCGAMTTCCRACRTVAATTASVMAPGGIVYRFTPDGKDLRDQFASGFRNIYDGGVNRDGELFVYDADMEYDFNTSWYRPTRINHVVSGAEYGWRNGAGKYPEFYIDNLPATLNIGPGSPTGCTFGYGAKFPAKYQDAFYALDWSWGKIYAVHLTPNGSDLHRHEGRIRHRRPAARQRCHHRQRRRDVFHHWRPPRAERAVSGDLTLGKETTLLPDEEDQHFRLNRGHD